MRKNALTDMLLHWDSCNLSQRLAMLQNLENMMAKIEKRAARKVLINDINNVGKTITPDRFIDAFYDRESPEYITILNLNAYPIEIAEKITHEGFHAYVHDCLKGMARLRTISKFDKEKFMIEEENCESIQSEFEQRKIMPIFDYYFAEERLNYKETALHISRIIIGSVESIEDAMQLYDAFVLTLFSYIDNETGGEKLQQQIGVRFDDVVIDALNKNAFPKEDFSACKRICDDIEPDFLKFFEETVEKIKNFVGSIDLPLESMKKALENNIRSKYLNYITSILKMKKW